ncbi:MAG: MBL fold metallo-hydrolase, partial [Pseudomonadota bacterium]
CVGSALSIPVRAALASQQTNAAGTLAMLARLAVMVALAATPAAAQSVREPKAPSTEYDTSIASQCIAVAQDMNRDVPVHFASLTTPAQSNDDAYTVTISYQGHSTYLIESPEGATIATDYAGWLTDPVTPLAVTMNQAHSSHYTTLFKPGTEFVLPGWRDDGAPAQHSLMVRDVFVRNVTTDIVRFTPMPDGNSIFIFEVAGLCIGHLGHLHHELSDDHYAKIGRLDVVMVPVDGGLTLAHTSVKTLLERMRSSVVLPMHVRSMNALPAFIGYLGDDFAIERMRENRLRLSLRTLPKQPTVMLMPGVGGFSSFE